MGETGSNVEMAYKISEGGNHTAPHGSSFHDVLEIIEALVLAAVAVATAWSGYQSALWSSLRSVHYGESSKLRVAADVDATLAADSRTACTCSRARRSGTSATTSRRGRVEAEEHLQPARRGRKPKVTWKIYLACFEVEELFSYVLKHPSHIATMKQYFADAKAREACPGSRSSSDPLGDVNHESDEHPPANVQIGQKFTHDVIKALDPRARTGRRRRCSSRTTSTAGSTTT